MRNDYYVIHLGAYCSGEFSQIGPRGNNRDGIAASPTPIPLSVLRVKAPESNHRFRRTKTIPL